MIESCPRFWHPGTKGEFILALERKKMGKHKRANCSVCGKEMRKDYIKIHMRVHLKEKMKMGDMEKENLNQISDEKRVRAAEILRGKKVDALVKKYNIKKCFLNPNLKSALRAYRQKMKEEDVSAVQLQPWQKDLEEKMVPTNRKIIWIIGRNGNEGKTFFQQYFRRKVGNERCYLVSSSSIASRDIRHAMNKESIEDVEYFLFNVPRVCNLQYFNYDLVEQIKDGQMIDDKYESETVYLTKPNVVVVFSNNDPVYSVMSRDRWDVYEIKLMKLVKYEGINQEIYADRYKS